MRQTIMNYLDLIQTFLSFPPDKRSLFAYGNVQEISLSNAISAINKRIEDSTIPAGNVSTINSVGEIIRKMKFPVALSLLSSPRSLSSGDENFHFE